MKTDGLRASMIKKVPSVKIKKKTCSGQKWLHINVHTLIPRVCDILSFT